MPTDSTEAQAKRPSQRVRMIYWTTVTVLAGILGALVWKVVSFDPVVQGMSLNEVAWEASYTERGEPVPPQGPRDGYWGSRTPNPPEDERLGWRAPETRIPDLVNVDAKGLQRFTPTAPITHRILITGGSVAFGSYASTEANTYYHVIGRALEAQGLATEVTVFAAGAWKSSQDLRAFQVYAEESPVDLVIFLNALNDLTNGATSAALYGMKTDIDGNNIELPEGAKWKPGTHFHDYDQRVADYLGHMATANDLAKTTDTQVLVVLQPSLAEKRPLTRIEKTLLKGSLRPHRSRRALQNSYAGMRDGLEELSRQEGFSYVDASRIFDDETHTVFSDIWHFSDFGQEILGQLMAEQILPLLRPDTLNDAAP